MANGQKLYGFAHNVAGAFAAKKGTGAASADIASYFFALDQTASSATGGATVTGVVANGEINSATGCRLVSSLVDNFNDGTTDTNKWVSSADTGVTTAETSGALTITIPSSGGVYGSYSSVNTNFSLVGNYMRAKFTQMPSTDAGNEMMFRLADASTNSLVEILYEAPNIMARSTFHGQQTIWKQVTYSSTTHAWGRLRESDGSLYYETAPSTAADPPAESDWSVLAVVGSPIPLTNLRVWLMSGAWQAITTNTPAKFDAFNAGTTALGIYPTVFGVQGAMDVGSVTTSVVPSGPTLSGVVGTTALGTVTPNTTSNYTVTGVAGTTGLGSVTESGAASAAPFGTSATGSLGTVYVPAISVVVTGVAGTTGLGSVTITAAASVVPTGVEGTATLGLPTAVGANNYPVTGVSATSGQGSVGVVIGVGVTLTGMAGTTGLGSPTISPTCNVSPTGVIAGSAVGSVAVAGLKFYVPVTGVEGAVSTNNVTVTNRGSAPVSNVSGTVVLGTVSQQTFPIYIKSKVGAFTLRSTAGTQSIVGLGFTPKVVKFWFEEVATIGSANEIRRSFGAATASTAQWTSMGVFNNNSGSTSNQFMTTACLNVATGDASSPTTVLRADFTSLDTDGFTIHVSTGAAKTIYFEAIGGTGVTVKLGTFNTSPANAGGTQAVIGVGFKPKAIFFHAGPKRTDGAAENEVEQMFGFAAGTSQYSMNYYFMNNGTNSVHNSCLFNGYAIGGVQSDSTPTYAYKGSVTSYDVDGFTINYPYAPYYSTTIGYIAFAGACQYKAGTFVEPTGTGQQAITGINFTPYSGFIMSHGEPLATELKLSGVQSLGMFSFDYGSTSASYYSPYGGNAANMPVEVSAPGYPVVMTTGTASGVSSAQASLVDLNAVGFTLDWSKVDGKQFASAYFVAGLSTAPLTGVQANTSLGTEGVIAKASATLTGVSASGAVGTVVPTNVKRAALTGVQAMFDTGTLAIAGKASFAATGFGLTATLGTQDYVGNITTVASTGLGNTASLGDTVALAYANTYFPLMDGMTAATSSTIISGQVYTSVEVSGVVATGIAAPTPSVNHNAVVPSPSLVIRFGTIPQIVVSVAQFGIMQALPGQWTSSVGSNPDGWSSSDDAASGEWTTLPPA